MADDLLSGDLKNILNLLSAAAALGTAAMGLVDATKAWNGGPSNLGFGHIKRALDRFLVAGPGQVPALGRAQILETLKANWINGVPKADQKAKAKALIHLGLTQGNAPALAAAAGVDGALLASLAAKTASGEPPTQPEFAVLGQFDAVLMAVLDIAYERGDQLYRNGSKALAMVVSTIIAVLVGWIGYKELGWGYFGSSAFALSFIIGLGATALAPVAKDLASTLQAAAGAMRLVRRP
jgi:hypothetical protein